MGLIPYPILVKDFSPQKLYIINKRMYGYTANHATKADLTPGAVEGQGDGTNGNPQTRNQSERCMSQTRKAHTL